MPEGGFVLEIGAGTGQLTEHLLKRGDPVIALEIEGRLVRHLEQRFPDAPNLTLYPGDARIVDIDRVVAPGTPYSLVGNLPYFAANPIIRRLLEREPRPTEAVVMVQREVGRELAAAPGDASLLAISVQVYATAERLFDVPPEAFDPPPSVVSSVVRLTLRPAPLVPPERNEAFFRLVSNTFRNPRKQIHNSLARGTWLPPGGAAEALEAAGIAPSRRAETLTVDDWLRLLDACEAIAPRA